MSSKVYFIKAGDAIKIGVTDNLDRRVECIRSHCPLPVSVMAHFDGDGRDERFLHRRFSSANLHHEWFRPTKDLLSFVDDVNSGKFKRSDIYRIDTSGFPEKGICDLTKQELRALADKYKRKDICAHYRVSICFLYRHLRKYGLIKPNKPKQLSKEMVANIRRSYENGHTQQELAIKFRLAQSTISKIVNYLIHNNQGDLRFGGSAKVCYGNSRQEWSGL